MSNETGGNPLNIKVEGEVKTMIINRSNVDKLRLMDHARPIRPGRIKKLREVLESGKQFEGVFTFNDISDGRSPRRVEVLDGNHRLIAIQEHIMENPSAQVEVRYVLYDHLKGEERLRKFVAINDHAPVSRNDALCTGAGQIPLWELTEVRGFPVTLAKGPYPPTPHVRWSSLVRGYLGRYNIGYWGRDMEGTLGAARALGEQAHLELKEFMNDMVDVFGRPDSANEWLRRETLFAAVAKIYFINRLRLPRAEVTRRFREKIAKDSEVLETKDDRRTRSDVKLLVKAMVKAANRGLSSEKNRFVTAEQYQDQVEAARKIGVAVENEGGDRAVASRDELKAEAEAALREMEERARKAVADKRAAAAAKAAK